MDGWVEGWMTDGEIKYIYDLEQTLMRQNWSKFFKEVNGL